MLAALRYPIRWLFHKEFNDLRDKDILLDISAWSAADITITVKTLYMPYGVHVAKVKQHCANKNSCDQETHV